MTIAKTRKRIQSVTSKFRATTGGMPSIGIFYGLAGLANYLVENRPDPTVRLAFFTGKFVPIGYHPA